ncbi:MAG: type IV secretion protein DotN [Micavibrio sp. TMED27]|nr:type IV secretion protein DotN [Micavibrio sp.]OUT92621.1 MAG: type IV secretion protein DotN [Micavibrio sp. TMED27]|tara:strand:- start:741 stop:1466 length:726 start_codon:yes stop_codon:yes gene_type:complete
MYPITLGVGRAVPSSGAQAKKNKSGAGSAGSVSSADGKIPAELKQKIFERDNYTCQCCGFESKKYQEVLHKDFNLQNFNEDNLLTTCIFCHQCFHLDAVSTMRSGVLVWMPEIEQVDLHHIARAIYVARISQGPIAEAARKSLDLIMARREDVKKRIHTDDPYILSMVLKDYLSPGHYKMRDKKLDGVRLFPLDRRIIKESELEFNQFPQILAYWRSKDGPFGGKTPPKWVSIYKEIMEAA